MIYWCILVIDALWSDSWNWRSLKWFLRLTLVEVIPNIVDIMMTLSYQSQNVVQKLDRRALVQKVVQQMVDIKLCVSKFKSTGKLFCIGNQRRGGDADGGEAGIHPIPTVARVLSKAAKKERWSSSQSWRLRWRRFPTLLLGPSVGFSTTQRLLRYSFCLISRPKQSCPLYATIHSLQCILWEETVDIWTLEVKEIPGAYL